MPCGSSVYGDMWVGVAIVAGTVLMCNGWQALSSTTTRGTEGGRGGEGRGERMKDKKGRISQINRRVSIW